MFKYDALHKNDPSVRPQTRIPLKILWEDFQEALRKLSGRSEDSQQALRRLSGSSQKTLRKLSRDSQEALRRLPEAICGSKALEQLWKP